MLTSNSLELVRVRVMKWAVILLLCPLFHAGTGGRVRRIVGGRNADPPFEDEVAYQDPVTPETTLATTPLVFTSKDKKVAKVYGINNPDGGTKFLGIRYAEPPVGLYRFQRPRRLKLHGEVHATKYGPPCIQPAHDNAGYIGSEDCLYLNIFTPKGSAPVNKSSSGLPVMFWIHGGDFKRGSAAQYDPQPLVEKGIIVVTAQYRLGSLGFLSLGRLELPGNVGLFDVAAAMAWVRSYIGFFGGNNRAITPAGQGSGASIASFLGLNVIFRPFVKGIFAMSGCAISPFSVDKTEKKTAKEISDIQHCSMVDGLEFVRCMQQLSTAQIIRGDNILQEHMALTSEFPYNVASLTGPGPAEDGADDLRFLPLFLTDTPLSSLKKMKTKIPLLTGTNQGETNKAIGSSFAEISGKLLNPSFLHTGIFRDLLVANIGLYPNKTVSPQLSKLFNSGEYLNFFSQVLTPKLSDLQKIATHTADALFNLPAYVMSTLWSGNVYFYSFQHSPVVSSAEHFLPGSKLSKLGSTILPSKGPSHGDDISYLFNVQSLFGLPINVSIHTEADMKVRNHFTEMVAEFVKAGSPRISGAPEWKPFKPDTTSYMIIAEQPKLAKNFRKCQMALWTGDTGLLKSTECSFLAGAAEIVTDTLGAAGSTLLKSVKGVNDGLKPITDTLVRPINNLFRPILPGSSKGDSKPPTTRRPQLLGGILG